MTVRRVRLPEPVHAERHLTVVSTRGLRGAMIALPLLLVCLLFPALPVAVLLDGARGGEAWVALALCSGIGAAGAAWVVRAWRRPVPDTVVSDIGVLGDAESGWSNDIRWKALRRSPHAEVDVRVAMSTRRDETLQWLHFFTAPPGGGEAIERKLRLLIPMKFGCLAYANAFALRRAALLQLATRADPPLRFDPMLFVTMEVHPRRWTRMPWPRRVLAGLITVPIVSMFAATFTWLDWLPSVWWSVPLLVVGMVVCVGVALTVFGWLYPSLQGKPYVFLPPR
ncbi:MAG: hypothetical protein ABW067_04140 [Rhizobacter sp.]